MRLESLDVVVDLVAALPGRPLIGITGSPGAGKSTIAAALLERFGTDAALLPMDGYHLPQAELRRLGRRDRMGAPDTFDVDAFVQALAAVRRGGDVLARGFDRTIEEPVDDAVAVPASARVVIVEGNYLLLATGGWERVAPLLDATFFVEVPRDLRLSRLVARHERFGKSSDDALAWSLGPDEANAVLIEATAASADHVIALDAR